MEAVTKPQAAASNAVLDNKQNQPRGRTRSNRVRPFHSQGNAALCSFVLKKQLANLLNSPGSVAHNAKYLHMENLTGR